MRKIVLHFFIFICFVCNTNAQCTKLLDFAGTTNGSYPTGSFICDGTFLYAMTAYGGTNNAGTIFKIMPDGSNYTKLLDFDATNGKNPCGSLVYDNTFLYGMTEKGGVQDGGTIFKIKTDGSGFTKIWEFDIINGSNPYGSLIIDGNYMYGLTSGGGPYNQGVIFKIMIDGSNYSKLMTFTGTNGSDPNGSLIYDGNYLYGMTIIGGGNDLGTIFKIKPDGSDYTKLLDFAGTINGSMPYGSLIYDGNYLYGMTYSGGVNDKGTVFKVMPDGSNYTKMFDFSGTSDGSNPYSSLFYDGISLYGVTMLGGTSNNGVIFKIQTDGSNYVKLLDFGGVSNGGVPKGSLISDGSFLYGLTCRGGNNDLGVIYKFYDASGIDETNNSEIIEFFPNPAHDKATFILHDNAMIEILNINGQIEKSIYSNNTVSVDLTDLSLGIYFVKIITINEIVTKIFIKE